MDTSLIRQMVGEFRERNGFVGVKEHCFAAWYLHQSYQLPEIKALAQSSDGNYDFGIDAFHLADGGTLVLGQWGLLGNGVLGNGVWLGLLHK